MQQQLDNYEKQNFQDNQILEADQLNHIEDQAQGIIDAQNKINELYGKIIETISGDIEAIRDNITTNTQAIATINGNVTTNTQAIEINSGNITTNTQAIKKINGNIEALNDIVFKNRAYLLIGDSYGVSGYGSKGDAAEYAGSWAEYFINNFAPNPSNLHKYMCWAGAGFCEKGNSGAPLSTNFEVEKVFDNTDLSNYTPTFNDIIRDIQTNYGLNNFTDVVILAGWNDKDKTTDELSTQIEDAIKDIHSINSDIRIYLGMISWFNSKYEGCTSNDDYGFLGRKIQNEYANKLFKVEDAYKKICCQYKNVTYLTGIEQQFRRNPESMIGPDGLHPTASAKQSIAKTLYNCLSEGNANLPDIRSIYLMETYCDEKGWYWEKWSNGIAKIYCFSKQPENLTLTTEASGGGYASTEITLSFPGDLILKSIVHLGPFMVEHKHGDTPWGYLNFEYSGFERNEKKEIKGVKGYYLNNVDRTISSSFNYSFSIIGTWRDTVV